MPTIRVSGLVMGGAVAMIGYALIVIAFTRQVERASNRVPLAACTNVGQVAEAPVPPPSTTAPVAPSGPASAPSSTPDPTVGATSRGHDSGASELAVEEGRLFRFNPGGAAMSRDELARLIALGKALVRHPGSKATIQGFGDLPGTDPLMMGIAKHRAKVAQTLLAKAGVSEDRVTISFADMGSDARVARAILVITTPPISEIEKP